MSDVPQDVVNAFNALVEERGGSSRFTDFTLDVALAAVTMMADLRDASRPASDRVKTAEAVSRLLGQLPPVPAHDRRTSDKSGDLGGMDAHQLMHNYTRQIADDPDAVWVDRRVPLIQALCDKLVALAEDGSRAAAGLVDRLVTCIVGNHAHVPLVSHFQSQPVPGETPGDAFARLVGYADPDYADDAPPELARTPGPVQAPSSYRPPPEPAPTATSREPVADSYESRPPGVGAVGGPGASADTSTVEPPPWRGDPRLRGLRSVSTAGGDGPSIRFGR